MNVEVNAGLLEGHLGVDGTEGLVIGCCCAFLVEIRE
jgi:hypothetical protein